MRGTQALSPRRSGEFLGRHDGIAAFTVGQRKGLGIASRDPLYVLQVDAAAGRVVVGPDEDLLASGLRASRWSWVAGAPPEEPARGTLRIRHRHAGVAAVVEVEGEPASSAVRATFAAPQRAVTPGQAAVLYGGDEVIGGGWIEGPVS